MTAHQGLAESLAFPSLVAVIGIIATAVAAAAAALGQRRRDRCAAAAETLAAWAEFPYRVRRRSSDAPDVLTDLARHGHDLQERLANHRAWMQADGGRVSRAFLRALTQIDAEVRPALREAWQLDPVTKPTDMNLDGWGPGGCQAAIDEFAIAARRWPRRRRGDGETSRE
jgi:hypothetical protein